MCSDFMELPVPDEKFDAVVFCRFGKIQKFVERALELTNGKVFFIQNTSQQHSFAANEKRDKSINCIDGRYFLDGLGVHYSMRHLSSEMGQPLESREEAERFIAFYDGESCVQARADFLNKRLVSNDDPIFPLFLPSEKHFVVFEIDAF